MTAKLEKTNFFYLLPIIQKIKSDYNVTDEKIKINNSKIEILLCTDIFSELISYDGIKMKCNFLFSISDSTNNKVALKISCLLKNHFNNTFYPLQLDNKMKITHTSNFTNKINDLIQLIPTKHEIYKSIENYQFFYNGIKNQFYTLDYLYSKITDSFTLNAIQRKLKTSKFFPLFELETIQNDGNEETKITLEQFYNCWFETIRTGNADVIFRAQKQFEKKYK